MEIEERGIRHFRVGYILILFTPVLSFVGLILSVGVTITFWEGIQNYLLLIIVRTAWNSSIVILLIIGISLYLYGYLRREATDVEAKVILLFSFLLIMWGVVTYLFASGFYRDLIDWSMNPGVRALTIWDHMEYWTWELKAISWIGSGLLLAVTSVREMHAR